MSLDPSYLDYPKRGYGQDMDRYDWALAKDRAPVRLASGTQVAAMIVVACEHHVIDPKKIALRPSPWNGYAFSRSAPFHLA